MTPEEYDRLHRSNQPLPPASAGNIVQGLQSVSIGGGASQEDERKELEDAGYDYEGSEAWLACSRCQSP